MNAKMKRRLAATTGLIVIVLVVVLAVVGGNSAARTVSVAEALEVTDDAKIQVTGNVVENSFAIADDVLTFKIYDPEQDPAASDPLDVRYDGGVSATFGNDVTAICTGRRSDQGVLVCSELVTKCPSKYESGMDALDIAGLLEYGGKVLDKPVKLAATMKPGSLSDASADARFWAVDPETGDELAVRYAGALSEETSEGSSLVMTGSLGADGVFTATDVALEG